MNGILFTSIQYMQHQNWWRGTAMPGHRAWDVWTGTGKSPRVTPGSLCSCSPGPWAPQQRTDTWGSSSDALEHRTQHTNPITQNPLRLILPSLSHAPPLAPRSVAMALWQGARTCARAWQSRVRKGIHFCALMGSRKRETKTEIRWGQDCALLRIASSVPCIPQQDCSHVGA